jgi:methylenetetrahydrofolate dehydrogenase (NADP+) / methenyltetrahydrofolate cyclohydrolase
MVKILDGKAIAQQLYREVGEAIASVQAPRPPCLAVILVGNNPASQTYVGAKEKRCHEASIRSVRIDLPENIAQQELLNQIEALNQDAAIDGILVQLPLPPQIDTDAIIAQIDPSKDVDGLHPLNMGKLLMGHTDGFVPCTPQGVIWLLERSQIPLRGRRCVVVGRSNIVGKPLAALLLRRGIDATVTVAHSQTRDLAAITRQAEILIVAAGQPHLITGPMVSPGTIVVDVGIHRVNNRLTGDVDFDSVSPHCGAISPVPGGVGPMTIAGLLHNTLLSWRRRMALA